MYEGDRQPGAVKTGLAPDLLQQVLFTPELRPAVPASVVADFICKRQRIASGYAPKTAVDLLAWVKERLFIPADEWKALLGQAAAEDGISPRRRMGNLQNKLLRLASGHAQTATSDLIVAVEDAPVVQRILFGGSKPDRWVDLLTGQQRSIERLVNRADDDPVPDPASMLSQWLRFYGPLSVEQISQTLGLKRSTVESLLAQLVESQTLVSGRLVHGQPSPLFCDADNFESLLRLARRPKRSSMSPLPASCIVPFLARHQGVIGAVDNRRPIDACIAQLTCLGLPAAFWETEVLPARVAPYDPNAMDRLMQTAGFIWIGGPGRRLTFCSEADLDLLNPHTGTEDGESDGAVCDSDGIIDRFPDRRGRYALSDLMETSSTSAQTVLDMLWDAAWNGRVTNDTMMALRRHLHRKTGSSQPASPVLPARSGGSRRHRRRPAAIAWRGSVGTWRIVPEAETPQGLIAAEELVRERVRILLDRYGVLFRALLVNEHPPFQWPAIFRTLRLMELAGEVVGGVFFDGVSGPQFASAQLLGTLQEVDRMDTVFWISAQDPISLCGLRIDGLGDDLPRRAAGIHLVYGGKHLLMVSMAWGRRLSLRIGLDDPRLPDCLTLFDHLLHRPVAPRQRITIDTIDGKPAPQSRLLDLLRQRFDTLVETRSVTVYPKRGI